MLACFALLFASAAVGADPSSSATITTTTSSSSSSAAAAVSPALTPTTATCSSASANFITHRLPQQCLRSNWSSSSSSQLAATIQPPGLSSASAAEPVLASLSTSDLSIVQPPTSQDPQSSDAPLLATSLTPELSSTVSASGATPSLLPQEDQDSFLDAAKFLSFEDWKKQKLGEAANAAEAAGRARAQASQPQSRQRPGEGLDTLGEESEISLDFGFADAVRPPPGAGTPGASSNQPPEQSHTASADAAPRLRNKDAGRTCKERFNYASFDCAASVLKTNPKCKSSTSVLVENKDSYMLNECSTDNKFLIVELCEHVEIDTIVLANFEFFSSMFRTFRISASDRYPVKIDKWAVLGTFEARNTREIQAFLVENPLIWAKYLRIEFLSHYGNEFYCPLSLLRVHGTNMVEDFRRMTDSGEDVEEPETALVSVVEPAQVQPPATESQAELPANVPIPQREDDTVHRDSSEERLTLQSCLRSPLEDSADFCRVAFPAPASSRPYSTFAFTQDASGREASHGNTYHSSTNTASVAPTSEKVEPATSTIAAATSTSPAPSTPAAASPSFAAASNAETSNAPPPSSPSSSDGSAAVSSATETSLSKSSSPIPSSASAIAAAASSTSLRPSSSVKIAVAPQKEQSPSPQPPGQESIFKSITKRLALLEANATLSLQYIESQSALLRSAFSATNSQQLNKTAIFLEKLNSTVLTELTRAKADYDQLWQSTVLELHDQREESRKEREILGERVRMLAEEVIGTKRLMAAQAMLLLVALGLVIFTRNAPVPEGSSNSMDLGFLSNSVTGLMSHGRSRSNPKAAPRSTSNPRSRWQWEVMSPWISPPQSRPGTSASYARDHDRRFSDDSGSDRPQDKPLPPRPSIESDGEHSDATSERRDTVTQRNYRPALRLDAAQTNGIYDAASPLSPDEGTLTPHNLLRDVQSAPTTPSLNTADMSAEAKGLAGVVNGTGHRDEQR